jgi:hypothetical protein
MGQREDARGKSRTLRTLAVAIAIIAAAAHGQTTTRPDPTATPLATAKLQTVAAPETSMNRPPQVQLNAAQPAPDDGLGNYLRSARGEWPMQANVARDDPWNRLLLLTPKRPLLVDVAVFIDGKPYRNAREAWIDEALSAGKAKKETKEKDDATSSATPAEAGKVADPGEKSPTAGTSEADGPSNDRPPQVESQSSNASKTETAAAAAAAETKAAVDKPAGEKVTEPKADQQKDAEKSDEKKETPAEPSIPTVATQSRQAPGVQERLMNYLETIGPSVSREEIRWLLSEWGSGPPLVLLGPGLSWERAVSAPLLAHLDQDKDGSLNKDEVAGIVGRLKQADFNGDEIIEFSEMRRADPRPVATPHAIGYPLLVSIDETTNWPALSAELRRLYGRKAADMAMAEASTGDSPKLHDRVRGASAIAPDELRRLCERPADVTLRVDYATGEEQKAGLAILAISEELKQNKDAVTTAGDVVTVDLGNDYIEFSAAGGANGGADAGGSQIAIGAAIDGDPLLRTINRDQDERITSREIDTAIAYIKSLDRNGDGQAASDEIPMPIRFGVTHGPQVHQMLAAGRLAAREMASIPRATVAAPDWFVSMDRNSDGDLSPDEFLGNPDQFRGFDSDGDGRLSVAEATKTK